MNCLFCDIATGQLSANVVFEDTNLIAFHDIKPQAPKHILVIPKQHIDTINDARSDDEALLGKMVLAAKHIAQMEGLSESGYRLVFNVNSDGGQEVYHIHLHILGGRQMNWPPG